MIDASLQCRACDRLPVRVPVSRDSVPVGAQVAIIGFLVVAFGWLLPMAC